MILRYKGKLKRVMNLCPAGLLYICSKNHKYLPKSEVSLKLCTCRFLTILPIVDIALKANLSQTTFLPFVI